jgi:catechol 2,3-dioxygenase-like lactoylglutathione lyase family enzyme
MFSYATLGAADIPAAQAFFDAVLNPLGIQRFYQDTASLAYRHPERPGDLWVLHPFNGAAPVGSNGGMLAFVAPSAQAVQAFHAAALAHGGTDEGAPGYREAYGPDFYVAYVRDVCGNKMSAVWRDPARRPPKAKP